MLDRGPEKPLWEHKEGTKMSAWEGQEGLPKEGHTWAWLWRMSRSSTSKTREKKLYTKAGRSEIAWRIWIRDSMRLKWRLGGVDRGLDRKRIMDFLRGQNKECAFDRSLGFFSQFPFNIFGFMHIRCLRPLSSVRLILRPFSQQFCDNYVLFIGQPSWDCKQPRPNHTPRKENIHKEKIFKNTLFTCYHHSTHKGAPSHI